MKSGIKRLIQLLGISLAILYCSNCTQAAYKAPPEEFIDKQGIKYYLSESEESSDFDYYVVGSFTQTYDKNGKPLYTKLVIPDKLFNKPVSRIGSAFRGHSELLSVKIGKNVDTLWKSFEGCTGLKDIDLVNVKDVKENAFKDCTSLERVTGQKKWERVLDEAFSGCVKLKKITIPKKIQWIPAYAFYGCKSLTKIVFKNEMSSIGDSAFEKCTKLKTIQFKKVREILELGNNVFKGTEWLNTFVKKKKPAIANGILLSADGLSGDVVIKDASIKCIAGGAFAMNKQIRSIKIDGVKDISDYAFKGCFAKKIIILRAKFIRSDILCDTNTVKKIKITGTPKISGFLFGSCKNTNEIKLYVPKERVKSVKKRFKCKVFAIT